MQKVVIDNSRARAEAKALSGRINELGGLLMTARLMIEEVQDEIESVRQEHLSLRLSVVTDTEHHFQSVTVLDKEPA